MKTSQIVAPLLTYLINLSFKKGKFPGELKKQELREGDKTDENNYRPISLLVIWSKSFERVMFNRVYTTSIYSNRKFGFPKNHSTIDALIHQIGKIRTNKNDSTSCFLDLKKTFDTTHQKILLSKSKSYDIRGNANAWFPSYLTKRYQRVEKMVLLPLGYQ